MRFAPQRRANFPQPNFQKVLRAEVFYTFWLANVLLATAACHFWTCGLPKVLRDRQFFNILTCKCASRYSGVQFFLSALSSYLRTRRFSEPTFRPSRHTNHWKNTVIRHFPNISRVSIFFQLTFAQLYLLSSDFTSLLCFSSSDSASLLFNCPYCRKLDFYTSFDQKIWRVYTSLYHTSASYWLAWSDVIGRAMPKNILQTHPLKRAENHQNEWCWVSAPRIVPFLSNATPKSLAFPGSEMNESANCAVKDTN